MDDDHDIPLKHRRGNRGSRGPHKIIGGATSTSCNPNFFCNLQLKVTLQTVSLLLTQKFSKIPQTPILKNTYCMKLYFEFDCLDCFSPIFAPPTEKSFPRLCSKSPKLLSTLTLLLCFLISALCYDSSRK